MPYRIVDIEVTQPLPSVETGPDDTGMAVLVRKRDRPIGFFLAALSPGTVLGPDELGSLLSARASVDILTAQLHDELAPPAPEPPAIDLTVVICTRNRVELLRTCLDSLFAVRDDDLNRFEILVVDNAPSDGRTRQLVAGMPGVRYVLEPRPGLDFARNRALAEVTTELMAFVDDDATVDRGWLAGLREAWSEHPDAAAVTGQVLPYELATDAQVAFERDGGFRRGFEKVRYVGQVRQGNPLYPTGPGIFGAGCNMAFRRDAVRAMGGFDDALDTGKPLPGGGDLDAFYRVVRSGQPLVYEPRALVFHRHRRDHEELRRQYWTWGSGFMAFIHKTYRADPEMRPRIRRMLAWWLLDQGKRVRTSLRDGTPVAPDLALAQLAGGVLTLPWMYPRSRRRTDAIRKRFQ